MKNKKEDNNQSISNFPSKHWEKFFGRFTEIDNDQLNVKDWDGVNIISYFCKKYLDYYKISYTFKFNSSAPSSSYEIVQFRKLGQMLSSNSEILKEYIDWFFQTQIITKKKRITSLAFLCDANIVNLFKFKKLAMDQTKNIERSTILPQNYINIISRHGYEYTTYGELAFHKKIVDNGSGTLEDQTLLNTLSLLSSFPLSSLDKVK